MQKLILLFGNQPHSQTCTLKCNDCAVMTVDFAKELRTLNSYVKFLDFGVQNSSSARQPLLDP